MARSRDLTINRLVNSHFLGLDISRRLFEQTQGITPDWKTDVSLHAILTYDPFDSYTGAQLVHQLALHLQHQGITDTHTYFGTPVEGLAMMTKNTPVFMRTTEKWQNDHSIKYSKGDPSLSAAEYVRFEACSTWGRFNRGKVVFGFDMKNPGNIFFSSLHTTASEATRLTSVLENYVDHHTDRPCTIYFDEKGPEQFDMADLAIITHNILSVAEIAKENRHSLVGGIMLGAALQGSGTPNAQTLIYS